jgi:ParB family chromosome partitioning protein
MELGLIENLQREDLNPMEERPLRTLMEEYGLTQEETARRVGKSVPPCKRHAPAGSAQRGRADAGKTESFPQGTPCPARPAESLAAAKDSRQGAGPGFSVRQTEALVKKMLKPQKQSVQPETQAQYALYLQEAEKDLGARLGRRVKIRSGRKKGKIEWNIYKPGRSGSAADALEHRRKNKRGHTHERGIGKKESRPSSARGRPGQTPQKVFGDGLSDHSVRGGPCASLWSYFMQQRKMKR